MKTMDTAAAKAREAAVNKQPLASFRDHHDAHAGYRGRGEEGRDNYGYDHQEVKRGYGDYYSYGAGEDQQHQHQQRQRQQEHPQYSNDYRRVYRDEADFYLHERDKLNKKDAPHRY